MTVLWLIVWLLSNTPYFSVGGNSWFIALIVCIIIDILTIFKEDL